MRSTTLFVVFICFTLLAGTEALAQQMRTTLRGNIRLANGGTPIVVRIQLRHFGMTIQELFVRENRFAFTDVENGRYTLVAEAPGFDTAVEDINVPGDWPVLELRRPRQPEQSSQPVPVWQLRVPESARRQFEAAKTKLLENNCAAALNHLRKAIQSYSDYGDAHTALGQCYAQMDQFDAAEQEVKRALEQPHRPELHVLLGKIYAREGNPSLQTRQLQLYEEEKPRQQSDRR